MYYMIINGFNTNTIPFCVVTDFGDIQGAKPRTLETDTIYGANGKYPILDGAYDGYERTFKFYVAKYDDATNIVNQFKDDRNELEFGYQLGSIFYCGSPEVKITPNGPHAWELEIKVDMQPFRYMKSVNDVVLVANGLVDNKGTIYSEPILVVEGNGECSLTIGKQTMVLNVNRQATIDCRHRYQNIYDQNNNVKNTSRVRGIFFTIPVGRTGVALSTNITKLTIKGNWRYKI